MTMAIGKDHMKPRGEFNECFCYQARVAKAFRCRCIVGHGVGSQSRHLVHRLK